MVGDPLVISLVAYAPRPVAVPTCLPAMCMGRPAAGTATSLRSARGCTGQPSPALKTCQVRFFS